MYTNAQYVNNLSGILCGIRCDINGVTSFVPIDETNTDYQNIMRLLGEAKIVIAPAEAT